MVSAALFIGAATAIVGILVRPFGLREAWWTCAGAAIVVGGGALSVDGAARAVADGSDVYFFLVGMMVLSEIARREGVFDWLAAHAVRAAGSSATRLFGLVYGVGVLVTALLSNDATAVVMTPAVLAAVRRAKLDPLPYAYACAFVANAASFILPISNPANLVLYGSRLPPLVLWFASFALSSLLAVGVTFAAMRVLFRRDLAERFAPSDTVPPLRGPARVAAFAVGASALAIVAVSLGGRDVGLATFACAALAYALVVARERGAMRLVREVQWAIVPMVAGLFVIVGAVERAGLLSAARAWLAGARGQGAGDVFLASFATAALCNVVNNLPVGLLAAGAFSGASVASTLREAVVVAVDLGPNLSVTGSLATVLWLGALRREGVATDPIAFLRYGACVTIPALAACAAASALFSR